MLRSTVASILLLQACVAGPLHDAFGLTMSFQIHSYNDIREWPQMLAKATAGSALSGGPVMFKIDPQYLASSDCHRMSRAAPDARGCLLLNHDSISSGSRTTFNTTADVLDFIQDPAYSRYFKGPQPVLISWCFKGCGGESCPCDGSNATLDWLSLVDDLVAAANRTIFDNGLNVQFVLDGAGAPGPTCLQQRWRPLISTYISGDDPDGAFTSDDPTQGFDRFAILNEDTSMWPVAAALHYGKFANKTAPYIVWEPSDQAGMLSIAKTYVSTGLPHSQPGGMRWAINTDPAQWAVYTGAVSGQAWNQPIVAGNSSSVPVYASLTAFPAPLGAGVADTFTGLAVWTWDDSRSVDKVGAASVSSSYLLWSFNVTGGPITQRGGGSIQLPAASELSLSPILLTNGSMLIVAAPSGPASNGANGLGATILLLQSSAASGLPGQAGTTWSLVPVATTPPPNLPPQVSRYTTSFVACGVNGTATVIDDICSIWAAAVTIDAGGAQTSPACAITVGVDHIGTGTINSTCIVGTSSDPVPTALLLSNIDSMSISAVAAAAAAVTVASPLSPSTLGAGSIPSLSAAVAYTANGTLYGATSCMTPSSGNDAIDIIVNDPSCWGSQWYDDGVQLQYPPGTFAPLAAYVGTGAGVSVLAPSSSSSPPNASGGPAVLIVSGGGHCPNYEAGNKQEYVALCEQAPPPPNVTYPSQYLTYHAGTIAAWTMQLLGAESWLWRDNVTGGASPCSSLIATGMMAMGSQPRPVLLQDQSQPLRLQAMMVHSGAVPGPGSSKVPDPVGCGAALPANGSLLLVSWPLPMDFIVDPS